MITTLTRNVGITLLVAAAILLAGIYWATSQLAEKLQRPMLDLGRQTTHAADHGYRNKINIAGPPEVEAVAKAINYLIEQAAATAEELERKVAEKTREEREARAIAEDARAIAEKVKEWRTELMAVNTHELLTPLRILVGQLEGAIDELRFLPVQQDEGCHHTPITFHAGHSTLIEALIEQVNVAMLIEEGRVEVCHSTKRFAPMIERIENSPRTGGNEAAKSAASGEPSR